MFSDKCLWAPAWIVRKGKLRIGRYGIFWFRLCSPHINCCSEWEKILTKQWFFGSEGWLMGWSIWKQNLLPVGKNNPGAQTRFCLRTQRILNLRIWCFLFISRLADNILWEIQGLTYNVSMAIWFIWVWKYDVMLVFVFFVHKMSRLDFINIGTFS